jgi:hypothetical protein
MSSVTERGLQANGLAFNVAEAQMTGSGRFVSGPWRYERLDGVDHWVPAHAPNASMSCSSISSAWLSARPGAVGAAAVVA